MSLLAFSSNVRLLVSTTLLASAATATPTATAAAATAAPGTPWLAVVRLREVGPRVRSLRLSDAVARAYFVEVAAPGAEARDRARPDGCAQRSGQVQHQEDAVLHAARLQPPLHGCSAAFAARDLTLRDAFALLVPMRTPSCALRQWFAGQSRCLQQRCHCQLQLN